MSHPNPKKRLLTQAASDSAAAASEPAAASRAGDDDAKKRRLEGAEAAAERAPLPDTQGAFGSADEGRRLCAPSKLASPTHARH